MGPLQIQFVLLPCPLQLSFFLCFCASVFLFFLSFSFSTSFFSVSFCIFLTYSQYFYFVLSVLLFSFSRLSLFSLSFLLIFLLVYLHMFLTFPDSIFHVIFTFVFVFLSYINILNIFFFLSFQILMDRQVDGIGGGSKVVKDPKNVNHFLSFKTCWIEL